MQFQIRFNRVPEKVPETVWEVSAQSQINFKSVPRKFNKDFIFGGVL